MFIKIHHVIADGIAGVATIGTSPNRVVGPGRNLALIRTSLGQVNQIAHAQHATVNDVLLTVTAGGLRELLHSRREPVDEPTVRIDVPVKLARHSSAIKHTAT